MEKKYLSKKEIVTFSAAALGQGMVYAAMSSYVSDFYLNVMGLSPLFVMLLLLFARVWDAVNDPVMGMIVDKAEPKRGKYKPYVLFSALPVAILTFLLFFEPAFADRTSSSYSERTTYVWVAVVYVLWGMTYTVCDVPFWSMPNALTPSANERGSAIAVARTVNGIGTAVPMAFIMILGFFDISYKTRYILMAILSAVIGCTLLTGCYFFSKERVKVPKQVEAETHISPLKLLFGNKQLMMVVLSGLLASGRYMLQTAAIHVSRYTFGLEGMTVAQSQSTVQLVFGICTAAGTFGAMLVCPFLIKKCSYRSLVLASCLGGGGAAAIGYAVGLVTGFNLWAFIPFLVLSSVPAGVLNVVCYAMIGDCLDDMEVRTGARTTGLGSACQTFVNKMGNALATTAIIAVYLAVGLNVGDAANVNSEFVSATEMSFAVRHGMFLLVTIVPALSMFLCCIPMCFYSLTGKRREEMLRQLEEKRRLSAGAGHRSLEQTIDPEAKNAAS